MGGLARHATGTLRGMRHGLRVLRSSTASYEVGPIQVTMEEGKDGKVWKQWEREKKTGQQTTVGIIKQKCQGTGKVTTTRIEVQKQTREPQRAKDVSNALCVAASEGRGWIFDGCLSGSVAVMEPAARRE